MKVLLEFKNSHHYWEEYELTKIFCPDCGKQEVWEEQGRGDYYEGVDYVCTECNFSFTMPSGDIAKGDRLEIPIQLKKGVANKPTTPKGN